MVQALFLGLVQKPTFLNELHELPPDDLLHVIEKIKLLASDPYPDGKLKKKLKKYDGLYRLRVGDYRVIYAFDEGYVTLLAVRHRDVVYRQGLDDLDDDELHVPESVMATALPEETQEVEVAATSLAQGTASQDSKPPGPQDTPLPKPLTREFLTQLNIPPEYHDTLLHCRTGDELLLCDVPERWVERILDVLYPRSIDEVEEQPDLVLQDPDDLKRFRDGELIAFLLRLDSEQQKVADATARGPAMIRGGPGTGKSTVALYRIRAVLDRAERQGHPQPRILFTTYTNALVRYSQQLLEQLLGPRAGAVTVQTSDHLAKDMVTRHLGHDLQMVDPAQARSILQEVLASFQPPGKDPADAVARLRFLQELRIDYLLYEFEWIIEGRDLRTLEQYLAANRAGRGIAFSASVREAVWSLYKAYAAALRKQGLSSWGSVRLEALELARTAGPQNKYDYVVIDEAQDLTPAALGFLVSLARDPQGIYLTADASQSLYSRGFTWHHVDEQLRFAGRSAVLRRNYRTTRQIAEAAAAFLKQTGAGDAESLELSHVLEGELPLLLSYRSDEEQWQLAAQFIREMSRQWRIKPSSAAVLAPTNNLVKAAAEKLRKQGIEAQAMRGTELDLSLNAVKVMTIHSAKGLEFPIVVIAYLNDDFFPQIGKVKDPGEIEELTQSSRRTLFVGMTRAMRALLVLYPGKGASPFIRDLDRQLWSTQQAR